jgi:hypothetical protein
MSDNTFRKTGAIKAVGYAHALLDRARFRPYTDRKQISVDRAR